MTKRTRASEIPLIKRPIAEIVRIANEAGRNAAANAELVQSASREMRFEWIGQAFPQGFGMSDDQFNGIVTQASNAFDKGIDEYCDSLVANKESVKSCPSSDAFSQAYREGVALALERLTEWEGSEQLPNEIGRALQLSVSDENVERRTGFAETIAAYLIGTMDFGPPIISRWPVFEDLTMKPGTRHE